MSLGFPSAFTTLGSSYCAVIDLNTPPWAIAQLELAVRDDGKAVVEVFSSAAGRTASFHRGETSGPTFDRRNALRSRNIARACFAISPADQMGSTSRRDYLSRTKNGYVASTRSRSK